MTAVIEAKSLSSLTTLASNPPRYPRNPTQQRHDPLVLYIARVPGSRDVFLSPMKPREKVVTAEDVQSSLYYVHFDSPDDDELKKEVALEAAFPGSQQSPVTEQTPIIRRPVRKPLPVLPSDETVSPSSSIRRKPVVPSPVLSSSRDTETLHNAHPSTASARPQYVAYQPRRSVELPDRRQENLRPGMENRRWSAQPPRRDPSPVKYAPELPPGRSGQLSGGGSPVRLSVDSYPNDRGFDGRFDSGSASPGAPGQQTDDGISLTLIRRDQASGAQWNVAKIRDPPVFDIYSDAFGRPVEERVKKPGAPLYIEISNPGYSKFLFNSEVSPPLAPRRSEDSMASVRGLQPEARNSCASQSAPVDTTFRRRIWLEGSQYAPDYFGHRKTASNDSGYSLGVPGPISPTGNRSPIGDELDGQRRIGIPRQERRSGYRGYVFESPWNGRCEFVTGGAGDSLKCKHILPVGNPVLQASEAVTVSELRFNLPSMRGTPSEHAAKRSSFIMRPQLRKQMPSLSTLDTSPGGSAQDILAGLSSLDLTLGQEFAGGGFGGKRAKLGKLIIQDEGLKMMDLIVATNMSLWWRAYERVEAAGR